MSSSKAMVCRSTFDGAMGAGVNSFCCSWRLVDGCAITDSEWWWKVEERKATDVVELARDVTCWTEAVRRRVMVR